MKVDIDQDLIDKTVWHFYSMNLKKHEAEQIVQDLIADSNAIGDIPVLIKSLEVLARQIADLRWEIDDLQEAIKNLG